MKKTNVIYLILFLFVILTAAPLIVLGAIPKPNECCQLGKHVLTDIDTACNTDAIVGPPPPAAWCDLNEDGNQDTIAAGNKTAKWGMCCLFDTMYDITDYFFWIFFVISIMAFILAGYCFLFSGGNPSQLEKGKGFLMWGVVALTVVVLSKVIPAVVKMIVL